MNRSLALGIDIGGTNTVFGIVNRRGEILYRGSMSTRDYPQIEGYIAALTKTVMPVLEAAGIEDIHGVGIGAPNGNFFTGEIAFAPNLPWQGIIPLARLVSKAMHMNVTITNDANAAAIGEMKYGIAQGMKDFILITLGTGLGSGFVANGELIYGHDGFAGELGHVNAVRNGRKCGCGRLGCLETYASATGIVRTALEWLENSNVKTVLRSRGTSISAHHIHEAAELGDAVALALFEYTGKILGETLSDTIAITSPEAIIFFGGLAKAGDLLVEPTQRHMEANVLNIYKNKVRICQSALSDADAAILGASALVW